MYRLSRTLRAGALVAVLCALAAGCGPDSGTGLFGSYNAKVTVRSPNVPLARENVRTIVERSNDGVLDKEVTDYDTGWRDFTERSTLTFRIPAQNFDHVIESIRNESVGQIEVREVKGQNAVEDRSDLQQIYDDIKKRLDGDTASANAQKQLKDLADQANRPVLVVDILPNEPLIGVIVRFIFSRLLWLVLAFLLGRLMFNRKQKRGYMQKMEHYREIQENLDLRTKKAIDEAARRTAALTTGQMVGGKRATDPKSESDSQPTETMMEPITDHPGTM